MKKFFNDHPAIKLSAFAIVTVFLLLISQTAFWLHSTIFNNQNFTNIATEAIEMESSRQSIATAIVDRALEGRPAIQSAIGWRLTNLVTGLLGTDLVEQSTEKAVQRAQLLVTTPRKPPVVLDLTGIKQTASTLADVLNRDGEQKVDPSKIPDQIVLIDTTKMLKIRNDACRLQDYTIVGNTASNGWVRIKKTAELFVQRFTQKPNENNLPKFTIS